MLKRFFDENSVDYSLFLNADLDEYKWNDQLKHFPIKWTSWDGVNSETSGLKKTSKMMSIVSNTWKESGHL